MRMDRDKRWDRTLSAYQAIAHGIGNTAPTVEIALQTSYNNGKSDEFIFPTVIGNPSPMNENDGIVFTNFRSDRATTDKNVFTQRY